MISQEFYPPIKHFLLQDERLQILQSLTQKMNLDPSVDLAYFAEASEGYTGADLKALLYNAQLEAIHELTGYCCVSECSAVTLLSRVVWCRHVNDLF